MIYYANLLDSGATIDLSDLPGDVWYYIQYFHNMRRQKEEKDRFEALFKGLVNIAKAMFKR